ncbi:MAG: hypothetical protein JSU06_08415 [Actinobacteria bacterium]|nr:hypothetical protein [Actinomycetota bacterium]
MNLERLAAWAAPLRGDRRLRIALAAICFAAVTLVTVLIAHPRMFTGFASYDDEGYMLTALKGFVNHGELYDRVFSQYGPFYYEFWGGIFSSFGIPVDHDAGRTVTTVVWVLSSLLFGLGMWRLTRSFLFGLATQVLAFSSLYVLTNEPMHPIGLIALLLAAIVLIAGFVRERESPYAMAVLGAALAALVLVKINVGIFAVISVALACAVSFPTLWRRRWPRLGIEVLFVAIPILLMLGKIGEGWARHYAVHVAISALAVVLVLRAREPARRAAADLRWLLGGFLVLAVVCCVAILGAGTSVHGLIDGVIKQPLRQGSAFTIALELSRRVYAFDVVGLGGACAYWYAVRRRGGAESSPLWLGIWSLFAIVVGVTMALSVPGQLLPFDSSSLAGYPLSMLPFAWVALVATTTGPEPSPSFARLLLPLLAVLQSLHAFPVAGSQVFLSALLLVPTGVLCVANGVRGLARATEAGPDRVALAGFGVVVAVTLSWFVVNVYLRESLDTARAGYDAAYPLHLPGASEVRLGSEEEVTLYTDVAHAIKRDCAATLMEPGMDSFYLWSEQEPPSFTATAWEKLFDEEHQERVIEATEGTKDLCLLRNRALAASWGLGEGVLVRYLEHGFRPIGKWGEYELLRREGPARAS